MASRPLSSGIEVARRIARVLPAPNMIGVFDQGASAAASFIPIVLVGRLAGPYDLALLSLATSAALLLTLAFQTLMLSAYPVFRAQDRAASETHLFYVLMFGLVSQAALLPLLALIAGAISGSYLASGTPSILLSFYVVTVVVRNYLRTVSLGRQDLRHIFILDAFLLFLVAFLSSWLALTDGIDIRNVTMALSAANIVFAASWLFSYRGDIHLKISGAGAYLVRTLAFGRWAFASVMVGSTVYFAPPWLLFVLQGTRETAIYAAGTTIVGIVNHFFLGLIRGIEGLTADSYHLGGAIALGETLRRLYWKVLPMLGVMVATILMAADALGGLILPDEPQATAWVARLLSLALLTSSVRVILGNGLWAKSQPQATLPASFILGACTLVLGPAAAYFAGAIGMACAVLAGDIASSVFLMLRYRVVAR